MEIVDVWPVDLVCSHRLTRMAKSVISEDDHCQARKFYHDDDRDKFLVSRGLLRRVLSHYVTKKSPSETNAIGELHPSTGKMGGLYYNLSHSYNKVVIAVCRTKRVGVDLEYLRPLPNLPEIFFRLGVDVPILKLNKDTEQTLGLVFGAWTDIEAAAKASGRSIFSIKAGQPNYNIVTTPGYQVKKLHIFPGYSASLAVKGEEEILIKYRFLHARH